MVCKLFNYNAFLAARAEILFFDNVPMDKLGLKNERLTNLEYLGTDMIEAGNEFGNETPYGSALIRVGQSEQRLDVFFHLDFRIMFSDLVLLRKNIYSPPTRE